jgi:hypothetical protein
VSARRRAQGLSSSSSSSSSSQLLKTEQDAGTRSIPWALKKNAHGNGDATHMSENDFRRFGQSSEERTVRSTGPTRSEHGKLIKTGSSGDTQYLLLA